MRHRHFSDNAVIPPGARRIRETPIAALEHPYTFSIINGSEERNGCDPASHHSIDSAGCIGMFQSGDWQLPIAHVGKQRAGLREISTPISSVSKACLDCCSRDLPIWIRVGQPRMAFSGVRMPRAPTRNCYRTPMKYRRLMITTIAIMPATIRPPTEKFGISGFAMKRYVHFTCHRFWGTPLARQTPVKAAGSR